MALEGHIVPAPDLMSLVRSPGARKLLLLAGVAAVVAIMATVMLWSQKPEYRVLFANVSDRDGGAIVASLQAMNIPYQFAEGGGAISVPAAQVHDARLKLAAQGLPKGGNVGFELMENQKLGVSQFLEQVNFQRALEGELARSIQSIGAIQAARVHLAMPKASVFVRDQQKPSASVLLNLHPGRTLDPQQVSAIVHLVASSVADLPVRNVTVVDGSGSLISSPNQAAGRNQLDASQLKYVHELQQDIAKRIESIVTPIVGAGNVRAEATAEVDFSHSEQAAETYKPNQSPDAAAIRSQQTSEARNGAGRSASGVPGALSNQPPATATAPLTAATAGAVAAADGGSPSQKDSTTSYEIDKTIRYVQQPMGGLKRISAAVVVNYQSDIDKAGKLTMKPLSEAEKIQITDLVKQAMGFKPERGDTLSLANSPFARTEAAAIVELPWWQRPALQELALTAIKYVLAALALLTLYFVLLKPLLKNLARGNPAPGALPDYSETVEPQSGMQPALAETVSPRTYQENLDAARRLAKQDPKVVANVIKEWVGGIE